MDRDSYRMNFIIDCLFSGRNILNCNKANIHLKHYKADMAIKKVVKIKNLSELSSMDELDYWMSKSPQERIEAIEYPRKIQYGDTTRLQRVVRIIQ